MRTVETSCSTRSDDEDAGGDGVHCFHELDAESDVCCWCGDVFLSDRGRKEHGPNIHFVHKIVSAFLTS